MKKLMFKTMLAGLILVFILSSLSIAEPGRGRRGGHRRRGPEAGRMRMQDPGDRMFGMMIRRLDLTEEQKEEVRDIRESYQDKIRDARQEVIKAMKELGEKVQDEAEESEIREIAAKVGVAMGDQAVIKVQQLKEIKSVLTEDQIEELEEMQDEFKERMEEFREERRDEAEDRKERRQQRIDNMLDKLFGNNDIDGDGALTLEELEAEGTRTPEFLIRRFDGIDENQDGKLDRDEIEEAVSAKARMHRKQRRNRD